MNNILVIGGSGQLGSELKELSPKFTKYSFFFTDRSQLDITKHPMVDAFITKNEIDTVINCAAYTAVDKAESEPDLANAINHLAVANLAQIAKDKSINLIHISTDYVFDGEQHRPYLESDETNPKSVYGKTKLAGERAMVTINPKNSIIIRTSWVFSSYGSNFVKTMLRLGAEREELGVIFDQVGTPTYAHDLAKAILDIIPKIKNQEVQLFHYANEGVCSWYDFAKAIFEISEVIVKVQPITTSQYPTPAKRPFYSVLNKTKIKETYHIEIPFWRVALKIFLQKIKKV